VASLHAVTSDARGFFALPGQFGGGPPALASRGATFPQRKRLGGSLLMTAPPRHGSSESDRARLGEVPGPVRVSLIDLGRNIS
jgi:hypothetical protein